MYDTPLGWLEVLESAGLTGSSFNILYYFSNSDTPDRFPKSSLVPFFNSLIVT